MKCRDNLAAQWRAPALSTDGEAHTVMFCARRITTDVENSNPVIRSFIASFDVASYKCRQCLAIKWWLSAFSLFL